MKHLKHILSAILLGMGLFIPSLQAQNGHQPDQITGQPYSDSQVNKQYDENGNIIRYDSTWTWSWSNMGDLGGLQGGNMSLDIDSLLNSMGFGGNFMQGFGNMDDFMRQSMQMMEQMMNGMELRMDTLHIGTPNFPAPAPRPDPNAPKIYKL